MKDPCAPQGAILRDRLADAAMQTASPFDLPVLDLEFLLRWEKPLKMRYPALPLTRLLRARLWRNLCRRGQVSCAAHGEERGEPPACAEPEACLAQAAFPLPGHSRSHHVGAVYLHAGGHHAQETRLVLRLLGNSGICMKDPTIQTLRAITTEGLRSEEHPNQATCSLLDERVYTVAERAAELAQSHAWRINLLSPWVARKGGSEKEDSGDLLDFLNGFPYSVAQRAYKFVALDLAERQRGGRKLAESMDAHALCLRARDLARQELSGLSIDAARIGRWRWKDESASNKHRMTLTCIFGDLSISTPRVEAAGSMAGWLAMLEALGGGEMTSEGYGAVGIEGIAQSSGNWRLNANSR